MHVGRDVPDHLAAKVVSGFTLVSGERIELIVRQDGRRPGADFLVITNARVAAINSEGDAARRVRLQVLADEIQSWQLARKIRSRLLVTSGFGATTQFGSGFAAFDDVPIETALSALISGRREPAVDKALIALRARAHWITGPSGRTVHVLERGVVPTDVGTHADLDMIEAQLRHCDYWPASEARRHVAICLPAGGCYLARDSAGAAGTGHEIASALLTVDSVKLRKSTGAEAGVVDRLLSAVAHIRSSPAWTAPHVNDAHVDLNDEVRDIAQAAYRAAELRAELGERPTSDSQTARRAGDVYDVSVASLDAVADRLLERVEALESYRDRLRALARELRDLDGAERIDRLAEKVTALTARTVSIDSFVDEPGVSGGQLANQRAGREASSPGIPKPRPAPDADLPRRPDRDGGSAVHDAGRLFKREAERLGTLMRTNVGSVRQVNDDD